MHNFKPKDKVKYIRNGTVFHARITLIGSTRIVFLDNGHRVPYECLELE